MVYTSKREKIQNFISKHILTALEDNDLDYNKTVSLIAMENACSENMVRETLNGFITVRKIILKGNILTIPEEKVVDWVQALKAREKEQKETEKKLEELEDAGEKNG